MTARRKAPPAAAPVTSDGRHPLARLAPLTLDPSTVADVGLIRAATNAMRALTPIDPALLAAARAHATAKGPTALNEFNAAPAQLIKRTVTAYAAQHTGADIVDAAPF